MIAARGIRVVRGGRAILDGVTATLEAGRVTAILGPNGAGKSTLVSVLAGILVPDGGEVRLGGERLEGLPPNERARRIALLPQGGSVAWNLGADAVVALGRLPYRRAFAGPSEVDRAAVAAAMAATEVAHLAQRPVGTLSGGERARVLLARALAGEPAVLLADEPLQNLDPRQQLRVADLLRAAAGRGVAVGVVVHDLPLARRLADEALLMAEGRVLAAGGADRVLTADALGAAFGVEVSAELVPRALLG